MTPLRAQMIQQMQLHRLAPQTQKAYVGAVAGLAVFYRRAPDQLTSSDIRASLQHVLVDRHLAWSTCHIVAAGLRFFSLETLEWETCQLMMPPRTGQRRFPRVLSVEEFQGLFAHAQSLKQRVVLMTAYAAGLRVSEVVRLRPLDIESHRMLIRVHQGKGRKDRSTLLSTRLLIELRVYWKQYRPASPWLFTGRPATESLAVRTAQKMCEDARHAAGIQRGLGIHTLRHCFAPHLSKPASTRGHPGLAGTLLHPHDDALSASDAGPPRQCPQSL